MADISGSWLGTYWQDEAQTRFEATFVQGGNALSGVILDDGHLGEANVGGEIIGRSIQFTKRYVVGSQLSIRYTGTLSEDENSIHGDWSITSTRRGSLQGKWEAHRSDNDLMADLKNRLSQRIPVGMK